MKNLFHTPLVGEKYRIAIGRNIMSAREFDSLEEAQAIVELYDWEVLINLMMYVNQCCEEMRKDNFIKSEEWEIKEKERFTGVNEMKFKVKGGVEDESN